MPAPLRAPYTDLTPIWGEVGALVVQNRCRVLDRPVKEARCVLWFKDLHMAGLTMAEALVLVPLCINITRGGFNRTEWALVLQDRYYTATRAKSTYQQMSLPIQGIFAWAVHDGWLPVAGDPEFALLAARSGLTGHEAAEAMTTSAPNRTVLAVMAALNQR